MCAGCRAYRDGEAGAVGPSSPKAGAGRACPGARGVTAVTQGAFARQGRPGARGAAATGLAWLAKPWLAPRRAEAGAARALAERAEQAPSTGRDSRTSSTEPSGAMHGAGPGLYFWGKGSPKIQAGRPSPPLPRRTRTPPTRRTRSGPSLASFQTPYFISYRIIIFTI